MSDKPRISVVIPVFNLEDYLSKAVDSVLNQTFRDFEIILVDDGSSDRSREIIAGYRARMPERVTAIFLDHGGAAAARNAGIDMARGEWIAFLDGDDVWKRDKLKIQLEEIQRNPGINFLSTAAEVLGQSMLLSETVPDETNIKLELLLKGCFITLSSALLSGKLLHSTRFDERLPGAQDLDLFLRLPDPIRFRFIAKPLVLYRIREGAISDPQATHGAQLECHYRIVKREAKNLALADRAAFIQHRRELHSVAARLAHEAAYFSLHHKSSTLTIRMILSLLAIREDPGRIKNYRFLLQALLPGLINRKLSDRKNRH